VLRLSVPEDLRATLTEMVAELVDWRLARYLDTRRTAGVIQLKVSHASGRPILLFDRGRDPEIPHGTVDVVAGDQVYEFDFVKIAVNVARTHSGPENRLPDLLRSWFGPDAGLPGTQHRVELGHGPDGGWILRPWRADGPADVALSRSGT
jgi:hypothetical protein